MFVKSLFVLFLLLCVTATASQHPPITLSEMIEQSAAVVRVKVLEVDEAGYDFSTGEAFTNVTVEVLDTLVGQVESELTLVFRGGLLPDGARQVWDIVPTLEQGQIYVLFLRAGEYFITPLVSPFILREVSIQNETVLVDPEGRLVELNLEYPQVGPAVIDVDDDVEDTQRQKGRRFSKRLLKNIQTTTQAFEMIRTVAKAHRNKSGAKPILPKRPSSLEPLKELMP